jgi:hypothetical protein
MVPAAGVEPATFRSGGERSNPLSYAGLNKMACFKETNQECPPFCPPFLTVFVPLVKYHAAADNGPIGAIDEPLKQREESESWCFRYYYFCGVDSSIKYSC